jgi:Domain of unknown function (DUF5658)
MKWLWYLTIWDMVTLTILVLVAGIAGEANPVTAALLRASPAAYLAFRVAGTGLFAWTTVELRATGGIASSLARVMAAVAYGAVGIGVALNTLSLLALTTTRGLW